MDQSDRSLGKYQIRESLGRGAMAGVYRAFHPTLEREVAIKVIHLHLADLGLARIVGTERLTQPRVGRAERHHRHDHLHAERPVVRSAGARGRHPLYTTCWVGRWHWPTTAAP